MSDKEIIISRYLVYSSFGGGLSITDEALKLYYGEDYVIQYNGINRNDLIRKDPAFYNIIRQLGISKTFYINCLDHNVNYCPINFVEFYTNSSPNLIPFDLWFSPNIHEYDGLESVREVRMLSPQIDYMKKIQQTIVLTSDERCLKYEEILGLEPPVIKYRTVELKDVFDWL